MPATEQPAVPGPLPPQNVVPVMPPAPAQIGVFAPQKPKKKSWLKAVVIGAAGAVLLGGATVGAYFGYYVPNKPENILKKALVNTFSPDLAKSVYMDGDFSFTDDSEDMTISGTLDGKADDEGNVDVALTVDALVTTIKVDIRGVDGNYYVKVSGLTGLPELLGVADDPNVQAYASLIDGIDDQWIEINKSLIEQFSGVESGSELSEADIKKLTDIYRKHSFLKVKQTLPDEVIKGAESHHYQVVVDQAELQAAFQELKNANIKSLKVTQDEIDAFKDSLQDAGLDKHPFDIWINKETKVINQFGFKVKDGESSVNFRISFFDFNKPVTVEKPEDARSVLEVLGPLFGGLLPGESEETLFDPAIIEELEAGGISL
jgi:hypothetical protein